MKPIERGLVLIMLTRGSLSLTSLGQARIPQPATGRFRPTGSSILQQTKIMTQTFAWVIILVHLLHTYSNTPELLTDLEAVSRTLRRTDLQDEPTLPSTERIWRLCDRLSEAEMDAVVASYYSGTSVAELARQYGINHWSVNKLVRERGHRFRKDGSEDATAAP